MRGPCLVLFVLMCTVVVQSAKTTPKTTTKGKTTTKKGKTTTKPKTTTTLKPKGSGNPFPPLLGSGPGTMPGGLPPWLEEKPVKPKGINLQDYKSFITPVLQNATPTERVAILKVLKNRKLTVTEVEAKLGAICAEIGESTKEDFDTYLKTREENEKAAHAKQLEIISKLSEKLDSLQEVYAKNTITKVQQAEEIDAIYAAESDKDMRQAMKFMIGLGKS